MLKEMAGSFKKSFEDILNFGEHRLNFAGIGDIGNGSLKNTADDIKNISKRTQSSNINNNKNALGVEINIRKYSEQELRKIDIDNQIKAFDISKATRLQKGNYGELLTEKNMYEMGDLENIMLDNVKLKSINDSTHQGIDLIFKNNTPPPEIVIVESEFKTIGKRPPDEPLLTTNKTNKQMDDNWIEINLDKAVGDEKAREIRDILKQDKRNYKLNGNTGTVNILKLASLIDQTGNIRYFEIGRDGEVLRELSKIEVEQILKN